MAAAASWWGAQTFGRCAPRMPALGSIRKCAQSMHAATSQDVEIMLGVDGTISRGVFFSVSSFSSSGKLEQYVQESQDTRTMGLFSLFAF